MKTAQQLIYALLNAGSNFLPDAGGLLYQRLGDNRPVQWEWLMPTRDEDYDMASVVAALTYIGPNTNIIGEERLGIR